MRKKLLLVATFLLAFMIFLVPIRAVESERCIIKIHLEDLQVQSSDMNGVKFYVYKIGVQTLKVRWNWYWMRKVFTCLWQRTIMHTV